MIDQVHHLATSADWGNRSSHHYEPVGLAAEGFIHLCTRDQLPGVVERYYRGRDDLVLLTVRTDRLDARLVEAERLGFRRAIVPEFATEEHEWRPTRQSGFEVVQVGRLSDALEAVDLA